MKQTRLVLSGVIAIGLAACSSDSTSSPQASANLSPQVSAMLADGFTTPTAGTGQTNNSFVASAPSSEGFAAWMPPGFIAGTFAHSDAELMGGGLGADFAGDASLVSPLADRGGDDDDRGPFEHFSMRNCPFSSTTGRLTCPTQNLFGLTINRSFAFTDKSGKPQQAFDTTTDAINTQITVAGTITSRRHDTTTVDQKSDQTVSGLAKGSTKRVVNSTSGGTETTKGTKDDSVKFVAKRVIGDTIVNLTVPVTDGRPHYPTAGTVTRSMSVTVTVGTQAPVTKTRREVITYDGSATAKVVITKNDSTKNCTQPLPHGHLTCS
jgi:hypothetical protein